MLKTTFCKLLNRLLPALFLLAGLGGTLYSLPPQKILQPGDWAYDALAVLSREQGVIFFSDMRITVAQMENFLAAINTDALSESGLAIYNRLASYLESEPWLSYASDAFSLNMDLVFQPEFYYKTNEHIPWIYNDHSRNSILLLPLGFSLGPWITAEMELNIGQNERAASLHRNYINFPWDPVPQFDIHFPKRAYMSAGLPVGEASGINLSFGAGNNFFGNTQTGSIIVSEHLERTVYAQAAFYSPAFKYTAQVLQYEVNKYHYMHYLQVRPHKTFSVSVAEGVMVNAPLELRFLNPFTIFHSYESYKTYSSYNEDLGHEKKDWDSLDELWEEGYDKTFDPNGHSRIGSYLGIKIEWQPLAFMRFYGLFVMDVLDLPMKKSNWMEGLYPDAIGFQAGADLSWPVKGGYWEFGLEGVYTYPYLYIMWDKGWSFYKEVPELDGYTLRYWTGTPFGPDTIAGTFWAGFRSNAGWYGGLSLVFSAQGERSDLGIFDLDKAVDDTYRPSHAVYDVTVPPTGIPLYTCTVSLRGEYVVKEGLSLAVQPGYRVTVNSGYEQGRVVSSSNREEGRVEHGFEMTLSLRLIMPY